MWIIDQIQALPPLLRYLSYATALAILGFLSQAVLAKRENKEFDSMLFVRYLALGFIVAGVLYMVLNHRDVLHV